jgi:hypothetical protein
VLLAAAPVGMPPCALAVIACCAACVHAAARYTSSAVQGTVSGLVEVPGYATSMLFLHFYPELLARGGWPLLLRILQG